MVKLVAKLRHFDLADALAISAGVRINIHDQQRVVEFAAGRIKRRHERIFLGWPLHGQPR
jgi:hypothetical protein